MSESLLQGVLLYDGSGTAPFEADILIRDRMIAEVAPAGKKVYPAAEKRDFHGLAAAPGFIDAHGHSDISLLAAPEAEGKLSQGVTTEIAGNCGLSVFPIVTGEVREHLQSLYRAYDVPVTWNDVVSYASELERRQPAMHLASLCGHNTLRASVLGYEDRPVTEAALQQMGELLRRMLHQGAAGFSTGLLYTPGCFSTKEELAGLMRVLGRFQRPYTTHLRSEGDELAEALEEALSLAETGNVPLQISHLKTALPRNWRKIEEVFQKIETAQAQGRSVFADRYPYTFSQTSLSIVLPGRFASMTDHAIRLALQDDAVFAEAESLLEHSPRDWSRSILSSTHAERYRIYSGKTLAEISLLTGKTPGRICAEILREDAEGSMGAFGGMSPENLSRILHKKYVCCGSDESVRPQSDRIGLSHPRGFGSFPRFFRMLAEDVPHEEIIRRMSGLPAEIFHLKGRGFIREGYYADIVIFDEEKFCDKADFVCPHAFCEGVRSVIVEGEFAWEGKLLKRNGHFLRISG